MKASRQPGFSQQILALPEGFETRIGAAASSFRPGKNSGLALARALYGDPFLVVLDEPNSNLDAEGEAALGDRDRRRGRARRHRRRHRSPAKRIGGGEIPGRHARTVKSCAFGPRDEVLRRPVQNAGDPGKHAASRGDGLRVVQRPQAPRDKSDAGYVERHSQQYSGRHGCHRGGRRCGDGLGLVRSYLKER